MNSPMHGPSNPMTNSVDSSVQSLLPRFEIRREIGAGSFGTVWDVFDKEREERVALKHLHHVDPTVLYRFKQEFRSLADIDHPNLVKLHELFCIDDTWFFTMDLIEGTNFLHYVRGGFTVHPEQQTLDDVQEGSGARDSYSDQRPPPDSTGDPIVVRSAPKAATLFDEERLRSALRQLAQGLEALHAADMLHRDIKPSNVLVSREGRLKILDFGLVQDASPGVDSPMTVDRQPVGTPAYMSPEQSVGVGVSQASDWYSVGVMLFEALTGARPFSGSLTDLLLAKQKLDPPDPRTLTSNIPDDLADLSLSLVSRQPGDRPSGLQVLRRLEGRELASSRRFSSRPPSIRSKSKFVGRLRQLELIRASFIAVLSGKPTAVRIIGKSGFGKSALVHRSAEMLKEHYPSTVVLKGRCYEQETVPYKALDSLVDALTRYLLSLPHTDAVELMPRNVSAIARLFPVLSRVRAVSSMPVVGREIADPQEQRARAFAALRELFARLADRRPLVLIIDDLQWGDTDSARFFCDLFAPPEAPMILLIETFREENLGSSPVLRVLDQREDRAGEELESTLVTVDPLEPTEARALVQSLLGPTAQESLVNAIAEESLGNPFFVRELVQRTRDYGEAPNEQPSIRLDKLLSERINRLPDAARHILEIIAIAGRPISRHVVARAATSRKEFGQAMSSLRQARLVLVRGGHDDDLVETYHDRVRETVDGMLTPPERAYLHKSLAYALLESSSKDTESLARHFLAAGETALAVTHLQRAADSAKEKLAFARAASLYTMLLQIAPDFEPVPTRDKLGYVLGLAGRGAEAARVYFEAASRADGSRTLELHQKAASQLLRAGYYDQGLAALRKVAHELGLYFPTSKWAALGSLVLQRIWMFLRGYGFTLRSLDHIPPRDLMRIDTCWSLMVGLAMINPVAGLDFQTRTLRMVLRSGERSRVVRALLWEATYLASRGTRTLVQSQRIIKRAVEISRQGDARGVAGLPQFADGVISFLSGQWKRAFEALEQGKDAFLQYPANEWEYINSCHYAIWALAYLGEYAEMQKRVKTRLRDSLERGDIFSATSISVGNSNLAWLLDDDPDTARREASAAISRWSKESYQLPHFFYDYAILQINLYCGNAVAAFETMESTWTKLRKTSFLRVVQHTRTEALQLRARCALAMAQASTEKRPQLLRLALSLAKDIVSQKAPYSTPYASLIFAATHYQNHEIDHSVRKLREAIDGFNLAHMAGYANAAKRRLGVVLNNQEGVVLINDADSWMHSQAIANPVSFTQMLAPGFDESIG